MNAFSSKLCFLRLAFSRYCSSKLNLVNVKVKFSQQFKVNNFPFASVLSFCQFCERRLTFEKLVRIYLKSS